MDTQFIKLNDGWNAEPNAPEPQIETTGSTLKLIFFRNWMMFPDVEEDSKMSLVFQNCHKYRLGRTNDEDWYRGQCRFSKIAPEWGEFYEVRGDLLDDQLNACDWKNLSTQGSTTRFLFYFRDETFECDAESFRILYS